MRSPSRVRSPARHLARMRSPSRACTFARQPARMRCPSRVSARVRSSAVTAESRVTRGSPGNTVRVAYVRS
ncbi:hypothetical protein BDV95DRAFT_575347 [Massariosphaeria phaeospora]|uniref:Uncharacterized protein n=1 Tax=Massariosphaeria phaeospora TaxID=100035 RepID=A0A7C8M4N6_9PLEO|nr:hypothetical protein BDV95DRAFT_575347 [Massariosphaeria phaeospora]